MNKILWKGFSVCTFLCMMTAAPAWADICFLPTGSCEQGAQTRSAEAKTCQDYIDEGIYYAEEQPDMNCSLANIAGCTLYECTAKSCEARGYKLGPTSSPEIWPSGYSTKFWECEYCQQGGQYRWKCSPRACPEGTYTEAEAVCEDGKIWTPTENEMSGTTPCGTCEIEECPSDSSTEMETEGCFTCSLVETLQSGTKCYRCTPMSEYVTATAKGDLDETCYTFKEKSSATGETCYLPTPLTCPINQYIERKGVGDDRYVCSCQDYRYEFEADGPDVEPDGSKTGDPHNTHESKILHYTAAGGVKDANVTSTQSGEETIVWPYDAPTSSGECSISKLNEGALLRVTCPKNPTLDTKTSTFTIKQVEADEVSTHTIDFKIIIDPDTCENPDAIVASCGKAGYASYDKGPNPACYQTHLEATCQKAGDVALDSGLRSIAGQICYYCINDTCPEGYTAGETPTPAEGYLTEQTDVGNNCYMEKPCPEGYSTDYPDINACTKNGHPEGWTFVANGMCGSKACGKCTPNICTGENKDVQCQLTPFCDPALASCGYKDPSTEYEGDTPKYNANIKPCPDGTAIDATAPVCGVVERTGAFSADKECLRGVEPNRDCSDGFTYSDETCSCVCTRTCGTNEILNKDTCTCEPNPHPCGVGNGRYGSPCCADTDCSATTEFPLYCFNIPSLDGTSEFSCRECGSLADGQEFYTNMSRYNAKCSGRSKENGLTYCEDGRYMDGAHDDDGNYYPRETAISVENGIVTMRYVSHGVQTSRDYGLGAERTRWRCRFGEWVTYTETYDLKGENDLGKQLNEVSKTSGVKREDLDKDNTCPAGSSKSNTGYFAGYTLFGSPCYYK